MIEVEDSEGVRCVRLNRPPSNSLTPEMLRNIRIAVETAGQDGIRCILLASRIKKYFSAGLDLDALFAPPKEKRIEIFLDLLDTHRTLALYPGPTIAGIGGYAMLGGWILAMACDFRWMAEETGRFALSEIRFGLSPTEFLLRRLRVMGADIVLSKQLVLRGKTLKAADGLKGGFVDRLVPAAELEEAVLQEARRLAKSPPTAYAAVKRSLIDSAGLADGLWERSIADFKKIFNGAEAQEGLLAMKEKRTPRWDRS